MIPTTWDEIALATAQLKPPVASAVVKQASASVPSLKGVLYRSMFGHSGWCATLGDWFDPRRTSEDYVPTGFKPYDAPTYAVRGHPFGLSLSEIDRAALIAFLKTL